MRPSVRKDIGNILLLVFLYVLQGIPLGLIASVPMILSNRHVSYKEQAKFSFAYWPFSLKLLWAPIVDALYLTKFGRRKTWLVPMQYLLGIFMLLLSSRVNDLLDTVNIGLITGVFFMLNFLAATQDIAVDGWALTMLRKENVGYASTCNSVGQTAGYFLGYVVFLALESADFCNNYLRFEDSPEGIVTLPSFLTFWGWVFMITTTVVWVFKKEEEERFSAEESMDVISSYKCLFQILKLPNIQKMLFFLLTCKIAFAATDSVVGLKLVEIGVPKDRMALLAIPLTPIQILLPLIISKYTAGPRSLNVFIKAYPFRLFFGLIFAGVVFITPSFKQADGSFPFIYYAMIVVIYAVQQVAVYSMFVALLAFFAKVSDPAVGGTYMTLLNTICNLGGNWPSTLVLWMVDPLTSMECHGGGSVVNDCSTPSLKDTCKAGGGTCDVMIDGFYVESVICVLVGIFWLAWGKPVAEKLESAPESSWRIALHRRRQD